MTDTTRATIDRRQLLKGSAALAGAAATTTLFTPAIHAQEAVTLRYVGTAVNQDQRIADKVKEDLGITIEYIPVTSDEVVQRAVTQPNSFDLLDAEYWMMKKIVPSGNVQGMDQSRIERSDDIVSIFKNGTVGDRSIGEQGTAPWEVTYLPEKNSSELVAEETQWMTLIPTVYNADTLGIRPDLIGRPIESWSELLNPEFAGKASILNIPSIGIMDAAMVAEAMGEVEYADKGNMTREEIDGTIALMTQAKRDGQFRAFWKDFNESVNLMSSGEVVIQSMWSPAVTAVRTKGIPCEYTPLKEGYRAWAAGFGLPSTLEGRKLDAAYEFVNWFLSGWAGAFLNRQGYYSAVLPTAKENMEPYEWAYWMEGAEAERDIMSPGGDKLADAGTVRDGGSFEQRMGSVACWNAVMDENVYMVRKWNEFIAA